MNLHVLLLISIMSSMFGLGISKFRGFPRRLRSEEPERDDNVEEMPKDIYERCTGDASFAGFVPPEPFTIPDDSDNVTLIVHRPAQWVLRDTDFIPDPFLADYAVPGSLFLCLEGDRRIFYVKNVQEGNRSLEVEKVDYLSINQNTLPGYVIGNIHWKLVSIRDSPVKGNIIVDVRMYVDGQGDIYCCHVRLVNNVLSLSDNCDCDETNGDWQVISLHAVKFKTINYEYCGDCWAGMLTLCSSADCSERVISIQVNNEIVSILPIVMNVYPQPPP